MKIPFFIRNIWSKITTGYWLEDLWNMDDYLARQIARGLKAYIKTKRNGHPEFAENQDKWNEILNELQDWFNWYSLEDSDWEHYERTEKILNLFAKSFPSLWD